ncbi:MAG: TrkH family potassium uptake protein [Caldilineaceae bacterium]|nr:TrkH family potassium uptake protein [Caldilineaceae bacterium]
MIGLAILLVDPAFHGKVANLLRWDERLSVALFTVVSTRTAGLTIVPLEELSEASQLMILLWMFIGGAPASSGRGCEHQHRGGVARCCAGHARGHTSAVSFGRTMPNETVAKAVAIMTVSTLLVVLIVLILSLRHEGEIFTVSFETVSAFANAGYSLDFTDRLDTAGRMLIAFTMFWGRLGPLTVVVALAQRAQPTLIRYPEEPVILG